MFDGDDKRTKLTAKKVEKYIRLVRLSEGDKVSVKHPTWDKSYSGTLNRVNWHPTENDRHGAPIVGDRVSVTHPVTKGKSYDATVTEQTAKGYKVQFDNEKELLDTTGLSRDAAVILNKLVEYVYKPRHLKLRRPHFYIEFDSLQEMDQILIRGTTPDNYPFKRTYVKKIFVAQPTLKRTKMILPSSSSSSSEVQSASSDNREDFLFGLEDEDSESGDLDGDMSTLFDMLDRIASKPTETRRLDNGSIGSQDKFWNELSDRVSFEDKADYDSVSSNDYNMRRRLTGHRTIPRLLREIEAASLA